VLVLDNSIVEATNVIMTWGFGEGDWEIGTRVDRTLEASSVMIGVHPKIAGVAAKLVLGAIKAVILTEILWRQQSNLGGGHVMARDNQVDMLTILTDEGPANFAIARHGGGTVHGLNISHGSLGIFDKIPAIWGNRERTASVENDVDDVITRISGDQGCNEVRIKVRALNVGV
jgi:hypothetical protein